MIGVKKIAHATYEMLDVDKQVEYYTEIMGLTVTGKEKDAVFLASTADARSTCERITPPKMVPRALVSFGSNSTLMAALRAMCWCSPR